MLFKVTHVGRDGHRRQAHVTACSMSDAMDQMDRQFGEPRAMACIRLQLRPRLVSITGVRMARVALGPRC